MKILDKYILSLFVKTLFTVFIILYFIFILQTVWLFISELAGKDLGFFIIIKFLIYYSPRIIPLVLPLSVLLASIMTFGSLAENYEFAAMKASGISLRRSVRILVYFIFILSAVSFWFANNVSPKAEYKSINLRKEIAYTKPAMAIVPGQFNDLGNINIKVDKKYGDNGKFLENITMHLKNSNSSKNNTVIRAENGELETDETTGILCLELFDGNYYEDITNNNINSTLTFPFSKTKFEKYTINIDLSTLDKDEEEENNKITNTNGMLNIRELNYAIDSLQTNKEAEKNSNISNLTLKFDRAFENINKSNYNSQKTLQIADSLLVAPSNSIEKFNLKDQNKILRSANNYINSVKSSAEYNKSLLVYNKYNINTHWMALYEKFVIAYSCFLMFYIGAPLGAIIKKGGIGLPIVFAIIIFISYHFINTFTKKLCQQIIIGPFWGAWTSSVLFTPLAILFSYKASNDMGVFNLSAISDNLTKILNKIKIFQNNENDNQ